MSLIYQAMEPFVAMKRNIQPDSEGGFLTTWEETDRFRAAVAFDISMDARLGEVNGVTSRYTVTVDKAVILMANDVIKRLSDGKVFRIRSDGTDKATPPSASIQIRVVTAEEWGLT